jgi:hypothetical protein
MMGIRGSRKVADMPRIGFAGFETTFVPPRLEMTELGQQNEFPPR